MIRQVSLVLVTYRSGQRSREAVVSFRAAARHAGLGDEVVVVDHSEDPGEMEVLESLDADALEMAPNRGYAAGVNRGLRHASGEVVVIANPDVVFAEPSIGVLVGALDDGWHLATPQLALGGFLFPPADLQHPGQEARRRVSSWTASSWRRFLARELRRWSRAWSATAPTSVPFASGAVLAATAATIEEIGPWPEDYFLFFEETEWVLRARRRGLRLAHVPGAVVRHAWGHAAAPGAMTGRFASSRRLYYRRCWGWRGRAALALPERPRALLRRPLGSGRALDPSGPWLVSPSAAGTPAALHRAGSVEEALESFRASLASPRELTLFRWDEGRGRVAEAFAVPA